MLRRLRTRIPRRTAFTIGIDGRCGAGKTTLGRLLARQLQIALVESDMWIVYRSTPPIVHYYADMRRLISMSHAAKRPVIIEGIELSKLCKSLHTKIDFYIWVQNSEVDPHDDDDIRMALELGELSAEVERYIAAYEPQNRAHFVFQMGHDPIAQ